MCVGMFTVCECVCVCVCVLEGVGLVDHLLGQLGEYEWAKSRIEGMICPGLKRLRRILYLKGNLGILLSY